jgi:CubicO group peptidase (beta-lactamase class C family)
MRKIIGFAVAFGIGSVSGCGSGAPGAPAAATVAPAAGKACAEPGAAWEAADPAALGLDAARLQDALNWASQHNTYTVAVYRHGCLAGQSALDTAGTAGNPYDGWSATKSVTSMIVGRAVTLGLFDIDQPIGEILPEADADHAVLTARHLLTMTAGLHQNYIRDFATPLPDRVCDALDLAREHEPGTHWQYAQSTLDLLLWALEKKTGRDVQEFAQAELFGPVGIVAGTWTWDRDPQGHTNAWAHLKMKNGDWARLGRLMMQNGVWNGARVLSEDYIRQALTGHPDNPAYGLLFWMNGRGWWRVPDVEGDDTGEGSVLPAGPDDMYMMVGLGEQRVYMIPSRDLIIVRLGERGSHEADTRVALWSGRGGEIDWELPRRVLLAVDDVPYADPGPYESAGARTPPSEGTIYNDAADAEEQADAMSTPPCHAH